MPIERRIREGAERNAGVLDPDIDRFLDTVVHETRRRQVAHRSLFGVGAAAAIMLAVFVGPSVLDGIEGANGNTPGSDPTSSVAPSVPTVVPFLTGEFTRSIPSGTAVVRANGIAGTWTISAGTDGRVRLLAPDSFAGADASAPFEMESDTLRTDAFSSDICEGFPAGTYTWTQPEDSLVLTPVSDPCDARVAVLSGGAWALAP